MADPKIKYDIDAQVTGQESVRGLADGLDQLDGSLSPQLAQRARELEQEIAKLGREQGLIDAFRRQKTAVLEAERAMLQTRQEATRLGRELAAVESPTAKQTAAFNRARTASSDAASAYNAQRRSLQDLRGQLQQAGISTTDLVGAQQRLRAQQDAVRTSIQQAADWSRRLTSEQKAAAVSSQQLGANARASAAGIKSQGDAARESVGELNKISSAIRTIGTVGIGGILGGQTAQLLGTLTETADAVANLQARVRLVTGEGQAFGQAWGRIGEIALETNSRLENTGTLFSRIAASGKELNLSQADALQVTRSINQAVQLSGSSAAASDAAITQLIQGLQSGVLRGEEFNSVMEQAPRLATALADALGVTRGQLRQMAQDGKLSSEVVIKALQSQAATLDQEFGKLPQTVGRSIQNLSTQWSLLVSNFNESSGATAAIASGINTLAANLEEIAGIATRTGAVLVAALAVQAAGAAKGLIADLGGVGGVIGKLGAQLSTLPKAINIVVAVTGFEVGFQIGQMLVENSALARKLGIGVTEFFTSLVNELQLVAEAAAAIFTDDTIGSAFERFTQRAREQQRIFGEMYAEAERSPEVVRAAAASAAAELQGLGDQGAASGKAIAAGMAPAASSASAVASAASDASGALASLAAAAGSALPKIGPQVKAQADELARMALAGGQAAQIFEARLPDAIGKLSGGELAQFRAALVGSLADAENQARRSAAALQDAGKSGAAELAKADQAARLAAQAVQTIGQQAAKSLGIDLAESAQTVSAEFQSQLDNLALLNSALPELAKTGVDTGDAIRQALAKMLDSAKSLADLDAVSARFKSLGVDAATAGDLVAKALDRKIEAASTEQAVDRLRTSIQAFGRAGQLSADQVAAAMSRLGSKLGEIQPGINTLEEAAKRLGVRVQAELKTAADETAQAWALIRNSTQVGLDDKIKAFAAFRKAAIDANGGVETAEIALQRRTIETQAAARGLGDAFKSAMGEAKASVQSAAAEVQAMATAARSAINSIGGSAAAASTAARNQSVQSTIRSDFSIDQKSGTIGSFWQKAPPDNSGNWRFEVDPRYTGGGRWVSTLSAAEQERQRNVGFRSPAGNGSAAVSAPVVAIAPTAATPIQQNSQGLEASLIEAVGQFRQVGVMLERLIDELPASLTQPAATRIDFNLPLPGGATVLGSFANQQSADAMSAWLRQLATDAARAGYPS